MNYIYIVLISLVIIMILLLNIRKFKKNLNKLKYLFVIIDKNIDKSLTEESIIRLHEEERALKANLENIKNLIHNDMPKWAKKTILYDKLKSEEKAVCLSYKKYVETKEEYKKLCGDLDSKIPKEILKEIEGYIWPKYYIDNKKQIYSLLLTVISCLVAVLSIIPIFDMFSKYFIIFALYPLIGLITVNVPRDPVKRKRYLFNVIYYITLFILIMFELYLALVNYFNWWTDYNAEIAFVLVLIILVLMLILKIILFIRKCKL